MTGIVFSTTTSTTLKICEGYALKIAYLLCDSVIALGEMGSMMEFNIIANKLDLKKRISLIENAMLANKDDVGYNYVQDVKQSIRQFKVSKHPTKEQIVLNAKVEKNFNDYFNQCVNNYNLHLNRLGLDEMGTLKEEDYFFSCPHEMDSNVVTNDIEPNKKLAESVVKLLYPSGNPEDCLINFLPIDFPCIDAERINRTSTLNITREEMVEDDQLVSMSQLMLTHIDRLSTTDLKSLRNHLKSTGKLFREKIDEVIKINCEGTKNLEERQLHIDEELYPVIANLLTTLNENNIFKYHKLNAHVDAMSFELHIGEAPVEYYWKYFEKYNIIGEITLKYAKELVAKMEGTRRMIPFIFVASFYINEDEMNALLVQDDDNIVKPRPRKFIAVDD